MKDSPLLGAASYRAVGSDIVSEVFDREVVVLNLATGRYFGLNPSASAIWEALISGAPFLEIQEAFGAQDSLDNFVETLLSNDLLAPNDSTNAMNTDLRKRLSECADRPEVEAYDDLADLIIADPIHDTEAEVGWPVRADADN